MEQGPQHNALMRRYEMQVEGKQAILEYLPQSEKVVVLNHTFVPPELRGKNIAAQLTKFALDDLRRQGKRIVPQCSYVHKYVEKHQQYQDLLAP